MRISLIVATAANGVIGVGGKLPWHISSDLKTFRRLTMGKPIIMGRRTFQSLKGPLDGRDNIVLSTDPFFEAPAGVSVVESFADALPLARTLALVRGAEEIMVIGGAEVFRVALPHAGRIYRTEVHANPEGDVAFPETDWSVWREVERHALPQGEKDDVAATLSVLERIPNTAGQGAS
jgi:dihydrofolate reductase